MNRLLPLLLLLGACASDDSGLREEIHQLKREVARLRKELNRQRPPQPETLARTIAGKVQDVDGAQVVITLGGDAGVQVDDIFHLRRGATYVGRITVTRVSKSDAAGDFDRQYPGAGAPPKRGDIVYLAHE